MNGIHYVKHVDSPVYNNVGDIVIPPIIILFSLAIPPPST